MTPCSLCGRPVGPNNRSGVCGVCRPKASRQAADPRGPLDRPPGTAERVARFARLAERELPLFEGHR